MKTKTLYFFGVLLIIASVLVYTHPWSGEEATAWDITLLGAGGQERVVSLDELKAMPTYTGRGGFFTTVGVVNGPYEVSGVPLIDLCELVGGVSASEIVMISATDGYSTVLDYDHLMGDFITYDPKTLKELPHGELRPVLTYELDGRSLSPDEGKPVRLAVVGEDGLLTEGLYWTKWANKIEVIDIETGNQ
jgi:DMSO/TMAO reductase YedYZ molybdopterin-dependent catalytic subunit